MGENVESVGASMLKAWGEMTDSARVTLLLFLAGIWFGYLGWDENAENKRHNQEILDRFTLFFDNQHATNLQRIENQKQLIEAWKRLATELNKDADGQHNTAIR